MNDVIDRLAALRVSENPTHGDTVAADVRRGRRALHRRRAVHGGVLAACALTVAGVAGASLYDPASHVHQHEALRLVTYTGEQLPGFTITKVPEGFVLQGATSYNLNVARPGDTSNISDFENKIVITLEWNSEPGRQPVAAPAPTADGWREGLAPRGVVTLERHGDRYKATFKDGHVEYHDLPHIQGSAQPPRVEPFEVDGDAVKVTTNEEGTRTLRYVHGDYTLAIQVWPTLGLTDEQLVEFADGVSVTSDAKPALG